MSQQAASRLRTAPWRNGTLLLIALIIGLCGLLYWHDPTFFWVCDYQLWYSPMFEEIFRSWKSGEWPILTQSSWAAGNLAGEYQCGTFSIWFNAWLFLIWHLPVNLATKAALLSTLHLAVLGTGTYLLGKRRGLSGPHATMAALATAMNGWMIMWGATEWFGALSGFTWVPWIWWAFLEIEEEPRANSAPWVLPAIFVYLLVAAGNPYAVMMGAVVMLWLWAQRIFRRQWRASFTIIIAGIIGLGLSAPAWMTLLEFSRGSNREELFSGKLQWGWTVPWRAWLALLLPSLKTPWRNFLDGWEEHVSLDMACGLVLPSAFFGALFHGRIRTLQSRRFDFALLALVVLLCMLPGFASFRWSYRWMPVFHLVFTLVAADGLRDLTQKQCAAWALGLTAGGWIFTSLLATNASVLFSGILMGIAAAWFVLEWVIRRSSPWALPLITASALLATFWLLPVKQQVSQHQFQQNLLEAQPLDRTRLYLSVHTFPNIVDEVASQPGFGTVLRPCNTALFAGLHFLNGYSSFSAPGVPQFFDTHGSLTAEMARTLTSPDSDPLLDLLGVDGLIMAPQFNGLAANLGPEWQKAFVAPEGTVYHRSPARFVQVKALAELQDEPGKSYGMPVLHLLENARRTVTVSVESAKMPMNEVDEDLGLIDPGQSSKPSAILFQRAWFPGYRATFNGREVPVRSYLGIVPLVELPPGAHGTLRLEYWPDSLRIGRVIAFGALALLVGSFLWKRRQISKGFGKRESIREPVSVTATTSS